MPSPKRTKIQAADVEVGSRTLDAVLLDLAERSVLAEERSARAEERSARAEERSARAEERSEIALQVIAALTKDIHTIAEKLHVFVGRTEERLSAIESQQASPAE
ncbi:MAG: hypothetical protein IPK82_08050 [Polyangiaceae bacterium]|nr:hypothetical protein [Polyangiaceae bacterium]